MGPTLGKFADSGSSIEATLSDSRQIGCDLLVAADGIRSPLRSVLFIPAKVLQHQAFLTDHFPAMWKKNEERLAEAI